MIGPVVVGVDESETAFAAAQVAAELAEALGAPLHVVSAFTQQASEVITGGGETWVVDAAEPARATAAGVALKLSSPTRTITSAAVAGKPAEAVVREAERIEAGLIVVGNRRVQGVARALGSIASSIAHHAPCDVYIAKTH